MYVVLESRRFWLADSELCLGRPPESKLRPVLGRVEVAPAAVTDRELPTNSGDLGDADPPW